MNKKIEKQPKPEIVTSGYEGGYYNNQTRINEWLVSAVESLIDAHNESIPAPSWPEPLSADEWLKRSDVVRPQWSREAPSSHEHIAYDDPNIVDVEYDRVPGFMKNPPEGSMTISAAEFRHWTDENASLRASIDSALKLLVIDRATFRCDAQSVHDAIETLSSALESKTEK